MDGAQIVTMELPHGEDALWYPEFNIVAVSPRLDAAGRERALDELQREWRRSLRPLPSRRPPAQRSLSGATPHAAR